MDRIIREDHTVARTIEHASVDEHRDIAMHGFDIAADPAAQSPSQNGGIIADPRLSEGGVAAAHKLVEITIEHARASLQEQVRSARCPAHGLSFELWRKLSSRGADLHRLRGVGCQSDRRQAFCATAAT